RLFLEQFEIIRNAACTPSEGAANACGLAPVTGQRREGISLFRFSDIRDSTELKFDPTLLLTMRSEAWLADCMKKNAGRNSRNVYSGIKI
ncbi:MAG: hypothetical protein RSC68_35645, partial [Acinetobacter sp.]